MSLEGHLRAHITQMAEHSEYDYFIIKSDKVTVLLASKLAFTVMLYTVTIFGLSLDRFMQLS